MDSNSSQYYALLHKCNTDGVLVFNNRTQTTTKVLMHEQIKIEIKDNIFYVPSLRNIALKNGAAELMWCLTGTKRTDFLQKYTKIWDQFIINGQIDNAYGYRQRSMRFDQIQMGIDKLKHDPSSRSCVIQIWDQEDMASSLPNVPCPTQYNVNLVNDECYVDVSFRSSDLYLGLPTDIIHFVLLGDIFATETKTKLKQVTFRLSNAHLYENQFELIDQLEYKPFPVILPSWSLKQCEIYPDKYIANIVTQQIDHPKKLGVKIIK